MRTGIGLAFVCVGAILAFAVTTNTSVFNLHTAGWVIMLVGVIGLLLPRRTYGWLGRRMMVRRTYPAGRSGGAAKVEEIPVPPYVARNPGTSRMRAGLPPRPTLLDEPDVDPVQATVPGATVRPAAPGSTTEVIEDLYESEE
jgi:hypothetical protein